MSISFNLISQGILTPGVFAEFDTSKAQQGPSIQVHRALMVGQRLTTGTKAAGSIDRITSAAQARQYYGPGSMLAAMAVAFLNENKLNQVFVYSFDDLLAGVKAVGSIDINGTATAAGVLGFLVAGRRYRIGVDIGDTGAALAIDLIAAITADADKQVTAAIDGVDTSKTNVTYVHKGAVGNEIDIRLDADLEIPAGLATVLVQPTGGAGNPDVTPLIAAMGETQYHEIAFPYTDSTSLALMKTELDDRWGPMRQNDGHLCGAKRGSVSGLSSFADVLNTEHETFIDVLGPNGPHEYAANLTAVLAREAQTDPARPIQAVALRSVQAPKVSELRTMGEANALLAEGFSTVKVVSGTVYIERLRTTRKKNSFGGDDSSLADVEPKETLSYLRYDFRTRFVQKFSRHKLANDGTRFGPGQAVLTPKIAKAELVAIFRSWEELGLVEGVDQFKRDLIVERNAADPNRLDIQMSPDLINQLRVSAAQLAFLL